jgi:hypothetical protein
MLTPRMLIASAALWCVAGITAGIVRTSQETAPPAAAESAEPVLVEILAKTDRLPVAPARAIVDRWYQPPPVERSDELLVEQKAEPATHRLQSNYRRRQLKPVDICARHGMHKVITKGGRSWRCRR